MQFDKLSWHCRSPIFWSCSSITFLGWSVGLYEVPSFDRLVNYYAVVHMSLDCSSWMTVAYNTTATSLTDGWVTPPLYSVSSLWSSQQCTRSVQQSIRESVFVFSWERHRLNGKRMVMIYYFKLLLILTYYFTTQYFLMVLFVVNILYRPRYTLIPEG